MNLFVVDMNKNNRCNPGCFYLKSLDTLMVDDISWLLASAEGVGGVVIFNNFATQRSISGMMKGSGMMNMSVVVEQECDRDRILF